MNSVLVFTGRSALDSADFRWQLLRVPDVSQVLKEAQQALDNQVESTVDLVSFIQRENNDYLAGGLWRELCAQLVQVGLYRRYAKLYSQPKFIIGSASGISASQVALGKTGITELIEAFSAEMNKRQEEEKSKEFLVGHRLETSQVIEQIDGVFTVTAEGKTTLALLEDIMKDHIVDQVITLGAAASLGASDALNELSVVESVVMDPLLSWLLPYLKSA